MTQMLQQNLNIVGCHYTRAGSISSAFSSTLGVLGGSKYLSITRTATGTYQAVLKNIYTEKVMTSLTAGGAASFLYAKNILLASAKIQYGGLTTTAIGTSGYYTTNVVIDTTNNMIVVYVYNFSAALADLPSTAKLVVDVTIGGLT